jgi:uncharacterized membrane protein YeaQ/YmgE (transglycosylase-associated protein family)
MLTFLLGLLVGGMVIGGLGRLVAPGPNPIGFWWTVACGLGGSLIGGLIGRRFLSSGLLVFVIEVLAAAALVVLVKRRRRGYLARRT